MKVTAIPLGILGVLLVGAGFLFWPGQPSPAPDYPGEAMQTEGGSARAEESVTKELSLNRNTLIAAVGPEIFRRIEESFASEFPQKYAETLNDFVLSQEAIFKEHLKQGKPLPLDDFFYPKDLLSDSIPLGHREELEALNLFQMGHLRVLLNQQNDSFRLFSQIPQEVWLRFSIEKMESTPFRYSPDVLFAFLTGRLPTDRELRNKLGAVRDQALIQLGDLRQRRWVMERAVSRILELDYDLDYHAPGYDDAVKLALDQVGMAQSLQDEEDMIMHRYLNQIRYEAQLANPDIVVR